ncbi:hypothetical protein NYE69_10345 [Paenibacillus sp. FSL R5-0527]|uniref:hypothetical protein n=1 Tax=Paenibacillus sp. FSL R5-0527 TaxID=2975321 RepID=UPI0030F704E2
MIRKQRRRYIQEKKIHSGEEDIFRRRRYIQEKKIYSGEVDMGEADLFDSLNLFKIIDRFMREASLRREESGKAQEKMKRP